MKLPDKIIKLRKANGWSQEDLAEKLNISRQAISRWENGTALPDANNILQLSRLFNVTADYLLNDDYSSDNDIPCVRQANKALESERVWSLAGSIVCILCTCFLLYQAITFSKLVYALLAAIAATFSAANLYMYIKNKNDN